MAYGFGPKPEQVGLLDGRVPTMLRHGNLSVEEVDSAYRRVLLRASADVQLIARACDRACRSLGFHYGAYDLCTIARMQEDEAERAVAIYQLVVDLGRADANASE